MFMYFIDLKTKAHRVYWCDTQPVCGHKIEFDGTPYMILGRMTLECHNGPDKNIAAKKKKQQLKIVNNSNPAMPVYM